jgi:phage terminase large subunit
MAEARRIILPYAPRGPFLAYHERRQRFAVGVAHRRCGKTVATINDQIKRALLTNREQYRAGYVAPFFNQAKDIAWEYLKRFSAPVLRKVNEGDAWVELLNGSRLRIYGADNPDRLRGGYFDDVALDEYADMYPGIWGSIIRPMLADRLGTATFIGTPKGRNSFHDLYERAGNDPEWSRFMLRASETGILSQKELDDARKDMTPEQYAQEFECSFDAAIVGAYYGTEVSAAEREGRIAEVAVDPALLVHTAWDLGIGDSTAIWFFQVAGAEIRVIDHYENHGQALAHYAGVLAAKKYRYGDDWVPHDAKVRELGTGRTRVETLIALGRKPRLVPDHKIDDGINAARLTIGKCWFDAMRCRDGLEALRQYRAEFDEKSRAFKSTPRHDWTSHTADGFRYLCMAWRELAPVAPPKPEKLFTIGEGNQVTMNDVWPKAARRRGF